MFALVPFVIAACAVWIYADATEHRIGKIPSEKGIFNLSAGGWAVLALLLWFVGIPCYFIKRRELILKAKKFPVDASGRTWKKTAMLVGLLPLVFVVINQMSTEWESKDFHVIARNGAASASGDRSAGDVADAGYSVDADGLVNSIRDERFYSQGGELRFDGETGFMVLENNHLRVCISDTSCTPPLALESRAKYGEPLGYQTDLEEGLNKYGFWVAIIARASVPASIKESIDGRYKSPDTIPAGIPWVMIENFRTGVTSRRRFSVRPFSKSNTGDSQSVSKPISPPDFDSMTDAEKNTCLEQVNMYMQLAAAQATSMGEARAQEKAVELINENTSARCREYAAYMHYKFGYSGPAPAAAVEAAANAKNRADAQINNVLEAYRKVLQK